MQLGVRWRAGDPPHRGVPEALHGEIARQEALHTDATAWTLTWLEGRPRLALDDSVTLTTSDGGVRVEEEPSAFIAEDADDDWLN